MASGPTWRAGPPRRLRRGAEATWQDACGPRRRRTGHVDARVGRHVSRSMRGDIRIVNRGILSPIYARPFPPFNPCGTMFPHDFVLQDAWAAWRALDVGGTAVIAWTESTRSSIKHVLKRKLK